MKHICTLNESITMYPVFYIFTKLFKQQLNSLERMLHFLYESNFRYKNVEFYHFRPIKTRRKILKDNMTEVEHRILFSEMQHITVS